ncbi:MAG TPA: T9SS type A sorting domain-containing protein [bacterium]|nr:T9SS type A sorting domain-containing protein [bacterium]
MKKLVILSTVLMLLVGLSFAQDITPIAEIQDTTGSDGDASAMLGETVTIQGVVSAESWAFDNSQYFVQDEEGKWSGILVYDSDRGNAYGDSVQITGTVDEYFGMTQIKDVTEYIKLDTLKHEVHPVEVTSGAVGTGGTDAEAYEGVLINIKNAEISNPDKGYGEWAIDDGSGECMVDDDGVAEYYFDPANYDSVKSITGVMNYSYDNTKIIPRLAYDIESGGKFTRIQRIQQVRHSDLLRTPTDGESDASYMDGDTMTVKAVVTMPTGLSYAGAGIKFIMEEPGGGPWSAILSYHEDSTAYPTLYEGDLVELTGYIGEYTTGSSNMTEFWITSPIQVVDWGQDLPPVDTVNTGDLRLPVTAEQWGNVMVAVKDAKVSEVGRPYDELFSVDDGTGSVIVDSDSDSLNKDTYPIPPLGTLYKSIRGWVYHHYGSYTDSSTYKLEPLYKSDLVKGSGPPQLANPSREPGSPAPDESVEISIEVTSNLEIDTVIAPMVIHDLTDWTPESEPPIVGKDTVALTHSEGAIYTGTIPAYPSDRGVLYHIEASNSVGTATMPGDTASKYGYFLLDEGLSIRHLQLSPSAKSLYDGYNVEVSGVVTVDTTFNNNFEAYVMQDQEGAWNGISVYGVSKFLSRGDEIKVYGQISESNPAWGYKWGDNTVILADSIELLSEGNTLPNPAEVSTSELSNDSEAAEMYESVLVKTSDVEVTAVNSYDWSIDDGSGSCLLDDDAAGSALSAWFDTLGVGNTMSIAQGPFIYSFGTFKITSRDLEDVGKEVAIDNNENIAYSYKLKQNYPNPFNPTTHVAFQIPEPKRVNISIYNILGQKVRTLTSRKYSTGSHILIWNGKNDNGATVPSGAYFMRMEAGNFTQVKKMLFLK